MASVTAESRIDRPYGRLECITISAWSAVVVLLLSLDAQTASERLSETLSGSWPKTIAHPSPKGEGFTDPLSGTLNMEICDLNFRLTRPIVARTLKIYTALIVILYQPGGKILIFFGL